MKILYFKKAIHLLDYYQLYEAHLKRTLDEEKARSETAKLKTSLLRFVLPEWGFVLKVDGNLSASETVEGLKFMEGISIYQAVHALEAQEKVFDRFGDRVSGASKRVYRSALKKMLNWGRSQDWWTQSVEPELNGKTPTMLVTQKRVEHWHKLKPKELPPGLSQQLDALSIYMTTIRQPNLAESSWTRYSRELLGAFGWLYRIKGIPLAELSLTHLVSVEAIHDISAAEQVVGSVREYLEWMRANIGDKSATLRFALDAFTYLAGYIHYETQSSPSTNKLIIPVVEKLTKLRTELRLVQYPKTTNRTRQADYAVDAEGLSRDLVRSLDQLFEAMIDPDAEIACFKKTVSLDTAMPRMGWIYRLLGWLNREMKIPIGNLSLSCLISFAPKKTALRRAKGFGTVRRIEQAALQAAEDTKKTLKAVLKWLRKERQIHPSTEKGIVEVFILIAKFLYYEETDSLIAENYSDIPVVIMLRQELKEAKERAKDAPPAADESLKWLDWLEFLACVHHLEAECQPTYSYGSKRSLTAIARSIQRFLLFAFLAYIPPDRQRTLRELEVGKTLVRGRLKPGGIFEAKDEGKWYIHLLPKDYKTGKSYGEQWLMVPDILYPHLDAWLNQWRAKFSPHHNFVFTKENGKPYDKPSDLSSIIRRATYRLTGKLTTSHLIRHMLITYMKQNGAPDEVLRSLADAMHHSTKMQSSIYDRRPKIEKVAPAQEAVLNLALGKPASQVLGGRSLTVEELAQQIQQLQSGDRQRLLDLVNQP